ncbi:erythroferrone [Pelodytes ibericus]
MCTEYKLIPLRCLLMTVSMGVLLILLCAGPACTHKNRGSTFQGVTGMPFLYIPLPTSPNAEVSNLGRVTPTVPVLQHPPWNPRESWLLFLRHSDRVSSSKKKGQDDHIRPHRPGPIGAPAPPKHHNQPLNTILHEKRLVHFLQLLSGLVKRQNGKSSSGHSRSPMVHAAFTCMTDQDTSLEPGKRVELQSYEQPELEGSFYRGSGLNLTTGRYTAPISGLYTFSARLKIGLTKQENVLNTHGYFQAQLCIQSLCQHKLSLQRTSSFASIEPPHTFSLHGVLHLQAGQYVSLFLENRMESWLLVEMGSDFSGVLIGL